MIPASNLLVLSDNVYLIRKFRELVNRKLESTHTKFAYACSLASSAAMAKVGIRPVKVGTQWPQLAADYDLVIWAHCKQLFPTDMVEAVRCVSIHPGFTPHNWGWFPQVFAILNKLPLGATIHEIGAELDHVAIIAQKPVSVHPYNTSLTVYNRVQEAELELLEEHIVAIVQGSYQLSEPSAEGNLNLKKDFDQLLELNPDEV